MLGQQFHYRPKIPVAILGATGTVGQRFVEILGHHPWFEIVAVAASERSNGKTYKQAVNWLMGTPIPAGVADMQVQACDPKIQASLVFSALDAAVAGDIESAFAKAGHIVVTNTRCHRMDPQVPLLIPEVNPDHLELLDHTETKIVANPNCSTIGLTLALKPLADRFGLEAVHVVTMQAVSGAGYPGVASLDILDNVIPYINGEEQKMETEPLKILGKLEKGIIIPSDLKLSATCNRVPVIDGHMECVNVKLKRKPGKEEMIEAWRSFSSEVQEMNSPLAPQHSIYYFDEDNYPQPRLHRNLDKGMAVSVGRLRDCPLLDYKFTILSHNTVRGAAGGAVLCGELLVKRGYVRW